MVDSLIDITQKAKKGLLSLPIGRDDLVNKICSIFAQDGKSNVMLLGNAGVGKTAIVEGIACKIADDSWPLKSIKTIYQLDGNALLSNTMYRGQYEEKARELMAFLTSKQDCIVFIDEIHTIVGLGKSFDEAAGDFSQILKPALARGDIVCIGATTNAEYQKYVASDTAFCRRFYNLDVPELDDDSVHEILKHKNSKMQLLDHLSFDDTALQNIIKFSHEKILNRYNPDKSIDVFERLKASLKAGNYGNASRAGNASLSMSDIMNMISVQIHDLEKGKYEDAVNKAFKLLGIQPGSYETVNVSLAKICDMLEGVF